MTEHFANAWNQEYSRQGIPSSYKDEPSSTLQWALSNLPYIATRPMNSAIDLGCGTGRNALALAESGFKKVAGLDFAEKALDIARQRPGSERVTFLRGDVTKPLPFEDGTFDLATDTFVYFHQLSDIQRKGYRQEIYRILKPGGLLLVSLATDRDGYYGTCEIGPLSDIQSSLRLAWDPVAKVGNILPTYDQFVAEFDDMFDLQMSWIKRKTGIMHGKGYARETVAILWQARSLK
ncbi:MAG: class I SAM-dependent methyltransferase [Candidatus Saccharimonadales bacterium]